MTRAVRLAALTSAALLAALLAASPVAAHAEQVWVPAAGPSIGRYLHTATLLRDGRVLVTGGGYFPSGTSVAGLASAEIYDPASDAWTGAAPMAVGRFSHTATLLADGSVLVAGGSSGPGVPTSTAELFDPRTGQWARVGDLAVARDRHVAAPLPDGRVLVAGGRMGLGAITKTAEIYDPATRTFTPAASMRQQRWGFTATPLRDGRVLVAGGVVASASVQPPKAAEIYDPKKGRWSDATDMVEWHIFHAACALADGRVLISGGRASLDFSVFPSSLAETWDGSAWSPSSMWFYRQDHTATCLPDGTAILAGGDSYGWPEIFDPATGSSTFGPPMISLRSTHTATLLADGRLLLVGGGGGLAGGLPSAEVLAPVTPIAIDVKPGEAANNVNIPGKAPIPVAVLSAPGFDASSAVRRSSIRFGVTGIEAPALRCHTEDVNGDRLLDLVCAFDGPSAGFYPGATAASLRALLTSGSAGVGQDAVQTIP